MEPDIQKLFSVLSSPEPPADLEERLKARVALVVSQTLHGRRRLAQAFLGLSALLFGSSVYAFGGSVVRSDFWQLLSLLTSDLSVLRTHFGNFVLSLGETFPALSLAAVLFPLFLLLLSCAWYLNLRDRRFTHYQLT